MRRVAVGLVGVALPPGRPAAVMLVPRLAVAQLPKQALAHHVVDEHGLAEVAAVLQHDAVLARLLGRIDQLPAPLDRLGRRHLRGRVLAGRHGRHTDRHVPLPRARGVDDQVELLGLAEALEVGLAARVAGRLGLAGRGRHVLAFGDALGDEVADGLDLDAVESQQEAQKVSPPVADADEPHAYPFQWRSLHLDGLSRVARPPHRPGRAGSRRKFRKIPATAPIIHRAFLSGKVLRSAPTASKRALFRPAYGRGRRRSTRGRAGNGDDTPTGRSCFARPGKVLLQAARAPHGVILTEGQGRSSMNRGC